MANLSFKIVSFDKCLVFQVTEMDDSFKAVSLVSSIEKKDYISQYGFKVISKSHPQINVDGELKEIELWGIDTEINPEVGVWYFKDNVERDKIREEIIHSLQECCEESDHWTDTSEKQTLVDASEEDHSFEPDLSAVIK